MFELAKTVLTKAGGNSSTAVLFTQPSASQNHRGPHRALHMCAFQIGLYALGLHNAVSPNWLSRTYSSHVSWITGLFNLLICIILMFFFLICYRNRLVNMYFFYVLFFGYRFTYKICKTFGIMDEILCPTYGLLTELNKLNT